MIKTKLTKKGYGILKSELTEEQIKNHTKRLTFTPNTQNVSLPFPVKPKPIPCYRFAPNYMWVPRVYGIETFGKPETSNNEGKEINIDFEGTLREKQTEMFELGKSKIDSLGGGIFALHCGFGKTALALYFVAHYSQKTLWIVHKTFLMNQAKEAIQKFLPGAKIGTLQRDTIDIENKDIVIGMLQSISMKDYPKEIFKEFGMVVIDECHHISSEKFSQALWKVSSKYMIGLSATPDRKDGLSRIFEMSIGPIVCEIKNTVRKPNIEFIHSYIFETEPCPVYHNGKTALPQMINTVCDSFDRTKVILDRIGELVKEQGRCILLISDRRNHLEVFYNFIPKWFPGTSVGYYVGGMKQSDLEESSKKQVILGTYAMSSEGLDIPALNTLILASPKSDVEQSVGRILRKDHPGIEPLVIDLVDHWGPFENQYYKRRRFYRKMEYKILEDSTTTKKTKKKTLDLSSTNVSSNKPPTGFESFFIKKK